MIDAVIYILAQLSGAVLGALLTKGLLLDEGRAVHYGAGSKSRACSPATSPVRRSRRSASSPSSW